MGAHKSILLTGSTGFLGKALVKRLVEDACYQLVAAVRCEKKNLVSGFQSIIVSDLEANTDWTLALSGIEVVIHAAARVHVMNDSASDPLTEFRKVNVDGTLNFARQAAAAGVKRFIFISSVKVNGERTELNKPFKPDDQFVPGDPYGLSKYEAEQKLLALAKKAGMEVVIIRPPLVYGPGVKANFASMVKCVNKGISLPLGAVHNKRSLVALDNLVDFIIHCSGHPKAANEVFIISDNEDVSTTELLRKVAKAFGKASYLLPIPVSWMTFVARLLGKEDVANRLFGSLQVDSSKARDLLNWKPVTTMDEQLKKTADAYLTKPGLPSFH